jgi:regulator of cell morphogenesis and NO signaling
MSTISGIDPAASLGELVAQRPGRAPLFEELRLDYCCGGRQTLAEACAKRGLEIDAVRTAIGTLDQANSRDAGCEDRDWRRATLTELCAHLVVVHHDDVRHAFPKIEALLSTVVRVHGPTHPELTALQRAFAGFRAELEPHLAAEEAELFPAAIARERHGTAIEERLLERHEREHAVVGHALSALRVLGRDYDRDHALCDTHRALLDALAAFELDLHRHVHEENNVLLPRMREMSASVTAPAPRPSDSRSAHGDPSSVQEAKPLARCCQAWIAEQTHAWVGRRP